MTDNFTVTPSLTPDTDVPPLSFDDGNFHCLTCGTILMYGGRGRHPKYCDDHKPNKGNSNNVPRTSQSMKMLEDSLTEMYMMAGGLVTLVDDFSGMVICDKADKLAASWIALAQTNPKVKKFLVKMTTGSGIGGVVIAHGLVALPILAHHDMLPSIFRRSGVSQEP